MNEREEITLARVRFMTGDVRLYDTSEPYVLHTLVPAKAATIQFVRGFVNEDGQLEELNA